MIPAICSKKSVREKKKVQADDELEELFLQLKDNMGPIILAPNCGSGIEWLLQKPMIVWRIPQMCVW